MLDKNIPPMETLESVPYIPREYIMAFENSRHELAFLKGDYESLEEHLSRLLYANHWLRIMDNIAACDSAGSFTRFSMPDNKTVLVFRNLVKGK